MIKFSTEKPPIYDAADKAFGPGLWDKGVIMTYGDTVYCKKGAMSLDLHDHEQTHVDQQTAYPGGAAAWWERYLVDAEFRLNQETAAYRNQVKYLRRHTHNPRKQRERIIQCAQDMANMYAGMVSFNDAYDLIT